MEQSAGRMMLDGLVCAATLIAMTAAGLALLRALGAERASVGERLLAGAMVGTALAGGAGLGLSALGWLRAGPITAVGVAAVLWGTGALSDVVKALRMPRLDRSTVTVLLVAALVLCAECVTFSAPPVGGDQTKYQLAYPQLYAQAGGLVETPWTFWGQQQFLQNFVFALGYGLTGDTLARLLNAVMGVLAAVSLGLLVERHLAPGAGVWAGVAFFTLPMSWTLVVKAGADLTLVAYSALGTLAFLDWQKSGRRGDLWCAALMAGGAGGSKIMGLLIPALLGVGVLAVLVRRGGDLRPRVGEALGFGVLAIALACPYYVRNAVDTGNPLYPFGYGVFGGRYWSDEASQYLSDYYGTYQATWAARRQGEPYRGWAVLWFPWDLAMHPDSFELTGRQTLDGGPFGLAFLPAALIVRRRRAAVWTAAAVGGAFFATIAVLAWPHPRYVLAGTALCFAAAVAGARTLLGARGFVGAMILSIALNLMLTTRTLRMLWVDQLRMTVGRMSSTEFLRKHSARYGFWEEAAPAVSAQGRVMVLEKIPHPYFISVPFVLLSYLEQGLIDYRRLETADDFRTAVEFLGATHVAVDLEGLDAKGDPFETKVTALWRRFLQDYCEPVLRRSGYGLYALRPGREGVGG